MPSSLAGKVDESGELTEKEIIRAERNAGYISSRLREIQVSFLKNVFKSIVYVTPKVMNFGL